MNQERGVFSIPGWQRAPWVKGVLCFWIFPVHFIDGFCFLRAYIMISKVRMILIGICLKIGVWYYGFVLGMFWIKQQKNRCDWIYRIFDIGILSLGFFVGDLNFSHTWNPGFSKAPLWACCASSGRFCFLIFLGWICLVFLFPLSFSFGWHGWPW